MDTSGSGSGARRLDRRTLLKGIGATSLGAALFPELWRQPAIAGSPGPSQLHLQFGNDPATEMTVSWTTPAPVSRPMVRFGPTSASMDRVVEASTVAFRDAHSGTAVYCHHARLSGLRPSSSYVYQASQAGAAPAGSAFRTAPTGRAPFRFTSFGDQCTGTAGDAISTPQGSWVVDQVEAADPLFHLLNGDLSYANTLGTSGNPAYDRSVVWDHFFANNQRSAMNRPWMPALGNHESELGNGPQGLAAYLSRFALPSNGSRDFPNNWYAFTVGSVRFVSVDANDVVYSTDFDFPILGYSNHEQQRWLEAELAASRGDPQIDWIVVWMHYPVMSTAGGSDLGLRQTFQPLFDRYGVDLVLTGHSHDYERMYPVRGVVPGSPTLEPAVVATTEGDGYDTSHGAVHLVVGTGGVALPSAIYGSPPGTHNAAVTVPGGGTENEPAPYSAVQDHENYFGFLMVDVDPGSVAGGQTTMSLSFFHTQPGGVPASAPYDTVTLRRRRSDGRAGRAA